MTPDSGQNPPFQEENMVPELEGNLYIVDDDPSARESLVEVFRAQGYMVREYTSAEAFLNDFDPSGPACVLLDERLPGMNGSDLLRRLSLDGIRTPAVMITAFASTPMTVDVMRHGAVNVLEKPCSATIVQNAVNSAIESDAKRIQRDKPALLARERLAQLSVSECEVLRLVIDGVPNKQIASKLGVCVRTVETRRSKIYQTTQVNSVAELARLCYVANWTSG